MLDLFNQEKVLALSWKQPFATAMLCGKIETRSWNTSYRGLVLICTSKNDYDEKTVRDICGDDLFFKMCLAMSRNASTLDLNGYAIAIGRLVNVLPMTENDEEKTFVKYRPDLFCHIYDDVQPIKPFQWKGIQGWKNVDQSIYKIQVLTNAQQT